MNEKHSGHLTTGLILLLALCGWVTDGEDGARRAVTHGIPLATPPLLSAEAMRHRFNARRIGHSDAPHLVAMVEALCHRAGLHRLPDIYVLPTYDAMNAYALGGRDASAITLTEGLLAGMTRSEVAAILAHEIAHICNDDGWTMTLASGLQRAISWIVTLNLADLPRTHASATARLVLSNAAAISELLGLALSRVREFAADALALDLVADPRALTSALEKLERHHNGGGPLQLGAIHRDYLRYLQSHPSTAQRVSTLNRLC